jgi:hypothetical protein
VVVDLLFASSGIEPEVIGAADRDDRQGPQDHDDLVLLLAVSLVQELQRAREAVLLITERGFQRGRDLKASLQTFLARQE